MTGAWITQADRDRWQRQAARELAAILDAHPGLPLIAWTVGPSGGSLSGRVIAGAGSPGRVHGLAAGTGPGRGSRGPCRRRQAAAWLHATRPPRRRPVSLTAMVPADGADAKVTS